MENAYAGNSLYRSIYHQRIKSISDLILQYAGANKNNLNYPYKDKPDVLLRASIFKVMTDTILILVGDTVLGTRPFMYNFDDFNGQGDWKNTFVTILLDKHKGNCHSLPYLYKIVAEELGIEAHLAMAPGHIYIKHHSEQTGMYNVELTSGSFPVDAWLMASGYIHLDAIRSGIYMDRLTNKQSIALCLSDLAKGFEKQFGYADTVFMDKCIDKVLEYYPNCINALLLRSELIRQQLNNAEEAALLTRWRLSIRSYRLIILWRIRQYRLMTQMAD